ncbi:MAG: hypothetical protein P8Y91_10995, partial [Desulfuromonadales bacterium]
GQGASVAADRVNGPIHVQLTGGSVLLNGMEASFNITGTDAQIELVESRGNGTVSGTNATILFRKV